MNEAKVVLSMATLRIIGALLEVGAALLMIRFGTVATALKINALLGLAGPAVLVAVSALGLVGIACHISPVKTALVALGVTLILIAAR